MWLDSQNDHLALLHHGCIVQRGASASSLHTHREHTLINHNAAVARAYPGLYLRMSFGGKLSGGSRPSLLEWQGQVVPSVSGRTRQMSTYTQSAQYRQTSKSLYDHNWGNNTWKPHNAGIHSYTHTQSNPWPYGLQSLQTLHKIMPIFILCSGNMHNRKGNLCVS